MNFLKRFTAAAVALVMVLVMVPAGALTADAATNTYVLESKLLTAFTAGAKADGDTELAGTNNFFTLHYSAKSKVDSSNKTWTDGYSSTQRVSFGGAGSVGATTKNVIEFTTSGASVVKLWWAKNGTDGRAPAIFDSTGTAVVSDTQTVAKNAVAYSEFTLNDAGTYYLGSTINGNYFFKVEVDETVGHTHNYTTVDTPATCTEQGYTTYTCSECGHSYVDNYVPATGHTYDPTTGLCVCGRCEHTVDSTYTFAASELTDAAADKEEIAAGTKHGTNNFFSVAGNVVKRTADKNPGPVKSVELAQAVGGSIDFTLTGNADVTVVVSSTGGSNTSAIALVDAYGTTVENNEGAATVTGSSGISLTYSNLNPGKYSVVTPENPEYPRNVRVYSITVNESSNAGCEHNPHVVQFTKDATGAFTATYTIPANTTHNFEVYNQAGATLFINDVEHGVLEGNMRYPDKFTIANDTAAEAVYVLKLVYPEGTVDNPTVLESIEHFVTNTTEGNDQGYYYTYTAPADGTITLSATAAEGITADLTVENKNTGVVKVLAWDAVNDEISLPVSQGDKVTITVGAYDEANSVYPAAEVVCTGSFTYPEGSEQNPIPVEFVMSEDYLTGTATVTAPVGTTYYQAYSVDGMILTINGVEYGALPYGGGRNPAVFSITNDGTAEAEYALVVTTPVGADMNPEKLETMGNFTVNTVEGNDQGYYLTYTAPADGVITMSATVVEEGTPFNVVMTNVNTYASRDLELDAVDGVITMPVSKGDVLSINVYTYDINWGPAPAATVNVTAEFKENTLFNIPSVTMNLGNSLSMIFYVPVENVTDGDYAQFTKVYADDRGTVTTTVKLDPSKLQTKNYNGVDCYLVGFDGIAAKEMNDNVTCVICNSADVAISKPATMSVKAYAEASYNAGKPALNTLLADLLNYGAEAQKSFGYDTGNPANAGVSAELMACATNTIDLTGKGHFVAGQGIQPAEMALILKNNTRLVLYYTDAGVELGMNVKVSYTNHNDKPVSEEGKVVELEGKKAVIVESLSAADFETDVTVEISNGTEVVSSCTVNMAQYCEKPSASTADISLALAKYCLSAYKFFHPVA